MNALAWMLAHKYMCVRVPVRPSIRPLVHTCVWRMRARWRERRKKKNEEIYNICAHYDFGAFASHIWYTSVASCISVFVVSILYLQHFSFATMQASLFALNTKLLHSLRFDGRVYQMQTICFFDDVVSVVVVDIVVVVVVAVAYVLFIWLKRNHKSGPSLTL